jgi:hypothetical protein
MNDRQRMILTRLVTGSLLLLLLLRLSEHAMLSGLASPRLFNVEVDLTYWLYKASGIPDFLVGHPAVAILFDILLFVSGLLTFWRPFNRIAIFFFAVLLFMYALTFDLYATHHLGQVAGFMIVLWPFLIRDNRKCWLAWEGMRYFACFIYFSAFCWKILPGNSFYDLHQGTIAFKSNLVDYIALNPGSNMTAVYSWFLRHEWLLNIGDKSIFLLEGVMVIGFFTRKYDRYLIWIPIIVHVVTYFFADVFFIELLVVDLSFLSLSQLDRLSRVLSLSDAPARQRKAISPR